MIDDDLQALIMVVGCQWR